MLDKVQAKKFRRYQMSVIGFHLLCASVFMMLAGFYLDKEDMK